VAKSFFLSDTTLATGVHAATNELEAAIGTATAGDVTISEATTTATLGFVWTTPSGEPGTGNWDTGNYTAVLDATVNDGNFSYAVGTIGGVAGHFARVDSGLTADQTTHEQVEADFTGTGLKSASTGSVSWGTPAASDRFEIAVVYQRADNHGTKSLTLQLNESDDEVVGQWTVPAGTGAQTLPSISQVGTGSVPVEGAAAQTLPSISQAGSAAQLYTALSDVDMGEIHSYLGPYNIGGDWYQPMVAPDGLAVVMMKSTVAEPADGDWISVGGDSAVTSGSGVIRSIWTYEHSSDIYCATHQNDGKIAFHLFDPGTDAFTVSNEKVIEVGDDGTDYDALLGENNSFGVSMYVRSDTDVVVGFAGDDNVGAGHTYVIVRTSGTWGSIIDVSGSTSKPPVLMGPNGSDVGIIWLYRTGLDVTGFSAVDTTGTISSVDSSTDAADVVVGPGTVIGGTYYGCYIDSANTITVSNDTIAVSPGAPTDVTGISDVTVYGHGRTAAPYAAFCLANDGTNVHLVYSRDTSESNPQDLYHDADAASGSTDVSLEVAAANRISCNVSGTTLAYVYDDAGTSKFGTKTLGAVDGAGAQTLPSIGQAGIGVMQPSAAATQTLGAITQIGTAEQPSTGTGAQTLGAIAQSATGVMQPEATAAQTLPSVMQAGVGAQEMIGASAQTLPSITQAGAADSILAPDATAAQTLPSITQAGAGIQTMSGTGEQTLPSVTQAGVGLMHPDVTAAQTLPSIIQAGAGEQTITGSGAQTLPSLTQAGVGVMRPDGSAAQTLPSIVQSASGAAGFNGAGAQTLPAITQAGIGLLQPDATAAQTLPSVTQAGAGLQEMSGAGAQILPSITQAGVGDMLPEATAAQTLPSITQVGAGNHADASVEGTGAQTLPSIMQAGSGAQMMSGAGAQTLPSLTQSGVGEQVFIGTGSQTLPAVAQAGVGVMEPEASAAQTLPSVTQQGAGELILLGTGAQALPSITQDGAAFTDAVGSAEQTLPAITQNAVAELVGAIVRRNLNQGLLANPSTLIERRISDP
jgi:hypothetical protein